MNLELDLYSSWAKEQLGNLTHLKLVRDMGLHLKRGHRWIFADCFDPSFKFPMGLGQLFYKGSTLALGLVQNDTQLRFRVLFELDKVQKDIDKKLNDYLRNQLASAISLRTIFNLQMTNAFRLVNGEGDGLPGMVIDLYGPLAVIKHDHLVAEKFYNHQSIAQLLIQFFPHLKGVYLKRSSKRVEQGEIIWGQMDRLTYFMENGIKFFSEVEEAAKTGFFLDQRENRALIGKFSKDCRVLNLFSYTGGFSLYAAKMGARSVTSIDIAPKATEIISNLYELNNINIPHQELTMDVFDYLSSNQDKEDFDIVITDPPSFAPNQKSVESAHEAYVNIFTRSIKRVRPGGFFAPASCSAHIPHQRFEKILGEALSRARVKAKVLNWSGQPSDHPYPFWMEELRYLKFALLQIH